MPGNSPARRLLKRALYPLLSDSAYQFLQCLAMAWDIRSGKLREPEVDLLPYAVQPGETALDIGANYGLYCFHLSHAVGRAGRVYAFEPIPFTFGTLRLVARVLRLRNVQLVDKGCSDRNGESTFTLPLQSTGALSAGQAHIIGRNDDRDGRERHARYDHAREVVCPIVRVDDFLVGDEDISFVKCDIEGSELLAMRGAVRTIDRCSPTVLCEINPWFLEGFGIDLGDLLHFFGERGYQLYRYDDHAHSLRPTQAADVNEDNYMFIHARRRDRFRALLT